jgi:hypothetical protein
MTAFNFDGSVTGQGGELLKSQPELFMFGTCISSIERAFDVENIGLAFITFKLLEIYL